MVDVEVEVDVFLVLGGVCVVVLVESLDDVEVVVVGCSTVFLGGDGGMDVD